MKYELMLEKVKEWIPPTDEHNGLKNFMIQQIADSIKWDCNNHDRPEIFITGEEWKFERLKDLAQDKDTYEERYEKEKIDTEKANNWIRKLYESLGE